MSARIMSCVWLKISVDAIWLLGSGVVDSRAEGEGLRRLAVESTSIASASYGRASKLLEIEFHSGAVYRYREVPESVFTAFSAARSKGNFFATQIRGKYAFNKQRGPNQ